MPTEEFQPEPKTSLAPFRIVAFYAVASIVWILFSDLLLGASVHDQRVATFLSVSKGFFFVLITTILLYYLIRRAMIRLSRSEQKFREVFDTATDAFFIHDAVTGDILYVNQTTLEMYGLTRKECADLKVADLSADPSERTQGEALKRILMTGGQEKMVFDWLCRRKDGTVFPVEVALKRTQIVDKTYVVANVRDITDRKQAEEQLAKYREHLEEMVRSRAAELAQTNDRLLVEIENHKKMEQALGGARHYLESIINALADPIFVKDRQHRWVLLNEVFCQFMGHRNDELIGKSDYDFFPRSEADVFWEKDEEVFRTRKENINEEFFTDGTGSKRIIVTKKAIYIDHSGQEFIVGIIRDITDLKKAASDLQAAQDQLVQSEKMAMIGQLAAGVAHEINNPVGYILTNLAVLEGYVNAIESLIQAYAQLEAVLRKDPAGVAEALEYVQELRISTDMDYVFSDFRKLMAETNGGAERVKRIVSDLRVFSSKDKELRETVNINDVVDLALSISWNRLKYHVEVEKIYGDIPPVLCYTRQMEQVFINLLINAADAIVGQGKVTIRTYARGDLVCVDVADTGPGITEQDLPRIFDPFFTTKEVGKGTGLGLAIVYNIMCKHQGEITVNSVVGQGTTFTVILPAGVRG